MPLFNRIELDHGILGPAGLVSLTHEATARMLKDSATFSLRKNGAIAGLRWWMPKLVQTLASNMLTTDEPDHTRLRSIVDEAFRRRAVMGMEPRIRAIADPDFRAHLVERAHARARHIGGRVRAMRLEAGLTQAAVAGKVGVSHEVITNLEAGKIEPQIDLIQHIAGVLGRRLRDFVEE